MKALLQSDFNRDSKFTLLQANTKQHENQEYMSLVQCSCGNQETLLNSVLKRKTKARLWCVECSKTVRNTKITKHGMSGKSSERHPLYSVYHDIKQRCYNPKSVNYSTYGLRGVYMCEEWLDSFESFYNWALASNWIKGDHIDKDVYCRQNNISPHYYSPETCEVISAALNTHVTKVRCNVSIHGMGVRKCNDTFSAYIWYQQKQLTIGNYKTELEAQIARDEFIVEKDLKHYMLADGSIYKL